MIRLLFTGVGRRIELIQAFREAAITLKKQIQIYGAEVDLTAPALAYCDGVRKVVPMKNPSYLGDLLSICQKDKIDVLVPTIDTDLEILSGNRSRFEAVGTKVLISNPEVIKICNDKKRTQEVFERLGFDTPTVVENWRDYDHGYPAFIKPREGSGSVDAFFIQNKDEMAVFANRIKNYIVQPFVSGKEFTIDVFCDWEGTPIFIAPRERIKIRAGEVLKTRIVMDPVMIRNARTICEELKPCGPLTIQLIRDAKGHDWFIEMNPRFGGGTPLSMKAGARSSEVLLQMMEGEKPETCEIEDGAIYARYDQSVCFFEGNREINGYIFDLDDTLYGEKEYVMSGFKAVAAYLNEDCEATLWTLFSHGAPAIDAVLEQLGRETEREEILNVYRNHEPKLHLYEGVEETLIKLREKGKKIGIITDGRLNAQRKKINALGLERYIDDIIITDELGGVQFRKPCDIAFRIMQMKWQLPASQIAYVGDNASKDFQAPRQLGMKPIWYVNKDGLYAGTMAYGVERIGNLRELL